MHQDQDNDIVQKIFDALNSRDYRWRTISGVAKQVGVGTDVVAKVIASHSDAVVRAPMSSRKGEPLFTTRAHLSETTTVGEKLLGAFKNRIY